MKIKLIILIVLFISIYANAQQTLTLEDCYSLATKNYPLSKQTRRCLPQIQGKQRNENPTMQYIPSL